VPPLEHHPRALESKSRNAEKSKSGGRQSTPGCEKDGEPEKSKSRKVLVDHRGQGAKCRKPRKVSAKLKDMFTFRLFGRVRFSIFRLFEKLDNTTYCSASREKCAFRVFRLFVSSDFRITFRPYDFSFFWIMVYFSTFRVPGDKSSICAPATTARHPTCHELAEATRTEAVAEERGIQSQDGQGYSLTSPLRRRECAAQGCGHLSSTPNSSGHCTVQSENTKNELATLKQIGRGDDPNGNPHCDLFQLRRTCLPPRIMQTKQPPKKVSRPKCGWANYGRPAPRKEKDTRLWEFEWPRHKGYNKAC
jgi:hypothetical protein